MLKMPVKANDIRIELNFDSIIMYYIIIFTNFAD